MRERQTTLDSWKRPQASNPMTIPTTKTSNQPFIESSAVHTIATHSMPIPTNNTMIQTSIRSSIPNEKNIPEIQHMSNSKYDIWGHSFGPKLENTTRIVLRNISSLPKEKTHNKNDILINEIIQSQADVYCATEINVAWQNIPAEQRIYERFKGKLEFAKYTYSNNKDKSFLGTYQPGGTLTITTGKMCGRIQESGTEDHILQRWSWQKFRGARNHKLVIANVYRPVFSNGPLSTYQQHKAVLLDMNIDECPRKNILTQLSLQIQQWQQEGYQIIVAGDFNEDVTTGNIRQYFEPLHMRELVIHQHGEHAPRTMIKGSTPIDGIFGSYDITPLRSGYRSFDWGLATDHRLIWIDIETTHLLGTNSIPLWKPAARRLKCTDPRTVKVFNKKRTEIFSNNKGFQLLQQLKDPSTYDSFKQWQDDFERLDQKRVNSIQAADKLCRRLKMGDVPWSPIIQSCMSNIAYLQRCRLKYINGYQINSRTLLKSFRSTTYTIPFTEPDKIITQLKTEFKTYNLQKKQADKLRFNFLEQLAAAQAEESNSTKEKIYKKLLLHESIRSTFRKIKFATKELRSGVTTVEAPNEQGIWIPVLEKNRIEQCCMEENIRKSTQASFSPTMQQTQRDLLGWKANTKIAHEILNGTIQDTTGIHPDIQKLIPFLKTPEEIGNQQIRTDITLEEYRWLWKRSREYTSCGISGLHFGHFYASSKDLELCKLDKWFLEISLNTGCSLPRWYNGINVMIPKKANSNRVDKLRTIVLMEPDFNLLNKIIGKRVMRMAEQADSIAPEQFGSRKKKSAIIHALNKQLTTDILRQDKTNFCLMILDAKDCYGRITPMMTSLAMKRQGATQAMMDLMLDTIAKMKHYIRTSFGDSDSTYQQGDIPFHGILQGNGAGPTIWAMISSILLDKLRHKGIGVRIQTLNNGILLIPAFAFVDDTDLLQQLEDENDVESPQNAVNEWATDLQTTGGSLVGDKCFYQVITHKWEQDTWKIDPNTNDRIKISIKNEQGEPIPIKQSSTETGEVALGIAFSPRGSMADEIQYLRNKTTKWSEKISKANLTHYEAWTALRTTVFKTIEYALPATMLSKKDIQYIISPALNSGLSKAGICRKTARKLIFGSIKYQGFGVKDPYVTQGVNKLQMLFNYTNKLTLQLIDESWRRCALECGIGPNLLLQPFEIYKPIITTSWISSLWEFVSYYNIAVHRIDHTTRFRIRQDSYLVQHTFQAHTWTNRQKTDFNFCRLYLQVETLSDIITANGLQIRRHILEGCTDNTMEKFTSIHHQVINPSRKAWRNWKQMLQKAYNVDNAGFIRPSVDPISPSSNWIWFLQPSTDRIIRRTNEGHQIYTASTSSKRTRNKIYQYRSQEATIPTAITPITVFTKGNGIKIDGIGTMKTTIIPTTLLDWSTTIQHTIQGDPITLQQYLMSEQIILMSDGSVTEEGGYTAWVITTPNAYGNKCYISGYGKIFEYPTDSHRTECFGILGALSTYRYYQNKWKLHPHPIHLVCDNTSAINYSGNDSRYPYINSTMPDFDVLIAIREVLKSYTHTFEHVKGHQDKSPRPWSILTTLNILVDQLASDAPEMWEQGSRTSFYDYLPGEKWQVSLGNTKLYKNIDSQIRDYITEQQLPDVWQKYKRVQKDWFHEVDWKAQHKAMQSSSIMTRLWILKRCARDCGAHAILKRRKERDDDFCPFCSQEETIEHVYKCQHTSVQEVWSRSMTELEAYLQEIRTDPNIIYQLLEGLEAWRNTTDTVPTPMVADQNHIGWSGFLEGTIGRHWPEEQQLYKTEDNLATSGKK